MSVTFWPQTSKGYLGRSEVKDQGIPPRWGEEWLRLELVGDHFAHDQLTSWYVFYPLFLDDGLRWTDFDTCATLSAFLLIDHVNFFSLFNRIFLTFVSTGSTRRTIFGYYECQGITPFIVENLPS